jgi:5,10-methylene-tetrahydrofolate dehydrogenase/methenyl tetrahydrofolate cyclohydrolase
MANIIDGKKISQEILQEIKAVVDKYSYVGIPSIAVIQVGSRKDSNLYIKKKQQACQLIGIQIKIYKYEINTKSSEICQLIDTLNNDTKTNGILVQLPLPVYMNNEKILSRISYLKDIDGFHARNIGNLAMENRTPLFIPCTPRGCLQLLKRYKITLIGKHAVIVGKSNIVGLPMALLLLKEMATVTVCHIDTIDIQKHLKMADIVVSACGQAEMIKKEWLKEGVVVIDVGINHLKDVTKKKGYRLVGDVDFKNVKDMASAITPVPGGVGPMTVAMLLFNALEGFLKQNGIQ